VAVTATVSGALPSLPTDDGFVETDGDIPHAYATP
jgi:hypothetical protein